MMNHRESPGGDHVIDEGSSEEDQRRMIYTVNALVSERVYGWERQLVQATGQWKWVNGEEEHPVPLDVVHNVALAFQALEALVDQNPGAVLWMSYGQNHGGYELTLHQGEQKAAHVAGRPVGLTVGLLILGALNVALRDEQTKLFPLIVG